MATKLNQVRQRPAFLLDHPRTLFERLENRRLFAVQQEIAAAPPLQNVAIEHASGVLDISVDSYIALRKGMPPASLTSTVTQPAKPTSKITFKGNVGYEAYTDVWIVATNGEPCIVTLDFFPGVYRMRESGPGIWDVYIWPIAHENGFRALPTTEYATFYAWDGGPVLKSSEAPVNDIPAFRPEPRLVFDANADGQYETVYVDAEAITNHLNVDEIVADTQDGHLAGTLLEVALVDDQLFGQFTNGSILLLNPDGPLPPEVSSPRPTTSSEGNLQDAKEEQADTAPMRSAFFEPVGFARDVRLSSPAFFAEIDDMLDSDHDDPLV